MLQANTAFTPVISELHTRGNYGELRHTARGIAIAVAEFSDTRLRGVGSPGRACLFGEAFRSGATALRILVVGHLVNALSGPVGFLLTMTGHERFAAKVIGAPRPVSAFCSMDFSFRHDFLERGDAFLRVAEPTRQPHPIWEAEPLKPNFFIIGAPKCGTSALCEYLRAHPRIGMSIPKEPHYFCTDYTTRFRTIYTEQEYLGCFDHVQDGCAAAGEGSVWYFFSEAAVANILRFAPDAKFIVMVRNPLDMVYSWHAQALYSRDETVAEFEIAWRLQSERAYGESVPRSTREPRFLQYRKVASLGEQLGRLYEQVTSDRVKVIVFDDFTNDTAKAYSDVLGFLGVPPDGRTDFPRINENKAHRSTALGHTLRRPPRALVRGVLGLKEVVGIRRLGIIDTLKTINTRRELRRPLDAKFRAELSSAFLRDVEQLSSLLQRDLSHWLSGSDTVVAP